MYKYVTLRKCSEISFKIVLTVIYCNTEDTQFQVLYVYSACHKYGRVDKVSSSSVYIQFSLINSRRLDYLAMISVH